MGGISWRWRLGLETRVRFSMTASVANDKTAAVFRGTLGRMGCVFGRALCFEDEQVNSFARGLIVLFACYWIGVLLNFLIQYGGSTDYLRWSPEAGVGLFFYWCLWRRFANSGNEKARGSPRDACGDRRLGKSMSRFLRGLTVLVACYLLGVLWRYLTLDDQAPGARIGRNPWKSELGLLLFLVWCLWPSAKKRDDRGEQATRSPNSLGGNPC